jgi:hypothetical protein
VVLCKKFFRFKKVEVIVKYEIFLYARDRLKRKSTLIFDTCIFENYV